MVPVVIAVPNPFKTTGHEIPLLPGTFVKVEISGYDLEQVVVVPRHAVHENNTVWTVEGEQLRLIPVTIVRTDQDTSYVSAGLEPGDLVVVSQLDAVTDGMLVRAVETATVVSDAATSSKSRSNNPIVGSQASGIRSQIEESLVFPETCSLLPGTTSQLGRPTYRAPCSTGPGSLA